MLSMSFKSIPATHAVRAEKTELVQTWWREKLITVQGLLLSGRELLTSSNKKIFLQSVEESASRLTSLSDSDLKDVVPAIARALRHLGIDHPATIAHSFALIREVCGRLLGMRHFNNQLLGGKAILSGKVAEMATGEGKTLTAVLPAATAALAGIPVHVVTANDYLTERDAGQMRPVYEFLGLSLGVVSAKTGIEERRAEYERDITYCTNKDLVFDYLRDCTVLKNGGHNAILQTETLFRDQASSNRLSLRGLHFAIVDEADSILIDDARTPLILSASRGGEEEETFLREAFSLSKQLKLDGDYVIDWKNKRIVLTENGVENLAQLVEPLGPLWSGKIRREDIVIQALMAQCFYERDKHYAVVDDKIQIIDENTGRILPDRSWQRGLHQLVELKEHCPVTPQRETLARLSYQRFFQRYRRLSGMTGTAREVRSELWQTYQLKTETIAPHKKCLRKLLSPTVTLNSQQHLNAIVAAIQKHHGNRQPVLVGTATVKESEVISGVLQKLGIQHQLLNAKQDQQEAEIVARAGSAGAVTISTQMAGRGTDIKLDVGARQQGGLHVILTQRFDAARIDRQLAGRCARQGDPGNFETILCAEHIDSKNLDLLVIKKWLATMIPENSIVNRFFVIRLLRHNQRRTEHYHRSLRRAVYKQDQQFQELLAFSGVGE